MSIRDSESYEVLQARVAELEAALRHARERTESVLASIADAYLIFDRQWRYVQVNDAALLSYGLPREQVLGRSLWEVHPDIIGTGLETRLRHAMDRRSAITFEYHYPKMGTWWENRLFPVAEGLALFATEITERKRAEQALRASEELANNHATYLKATLDAAPAIILMAHDRDGGIITGNHAARELCRVDEWTNISKRGPEPERAAHFRLLKDGNELKPEEMPLHVVAKTGRELRDYSLEFVRDDGAECSLLGNIVPVFDSEGNPNGAVAAFLDVSQRKRGLELLRESEERYRLLFSSSLDAVLLAAPDGRIFAANEAACRMFGFTEQELIGAGRSGVMDGSDPRLAIASEIRRRTGKFHGELTYLRKDGTKFFGETSSAVYMDLHGEWRTSSTIRDITERKQAEEALRKSEARLSLAINQAGMGTWDIDLLTGKGVWCESFFRLLGYEPRPGGEATFKMWCSRVHPEDRERVSQELEREREDHSVRMREYRVMRADTNEVVWLSVFARFLYDENGKAVRHIGIAFDSTRRKLMEEDLRQTNVYLENIFENSPDAIAIVDNRGWFIKWNKMAEDLYGYSFEDSKAKSAFDLYPDKDELEKMLTRLRREGSVQKWEMRMQRKDGSIAPFEISLGLLKDSQNQTLGCVGIARDLSERKRLEEKIREQLEFLQTLIDTIPNPIFYKDANGRYTGCNRAFLEITGKSMEEILGKTVYDIGPRDIAEGYEEKDRELFEHPGKQRYEWKVQNTLGEVREVIIDKATLFDTPHGAVSGLIGVFSDITERKQAEEALRKSEARLSLAINQAGMGTWDIDLLTGKGVWSESYFRVLGYEPRPGGEATIEMWWSRIHPEDRERVAQELERELVDHCEYMREYRIMRADTNEVVWLSVFGRFLYDENGKAVRHISIAFDSTRRKRMEEELRRSNNELDLMIQALSEKTANLEEVNAALRVLLRQREEDKKELRESVVANVRNLILPYTEKMKQSPLSSVQMTWMKLLESHMDEITSSFGRTLAAQYANLTSTEIRIAALVRDGKSTAQIAELSGISEKTVCRHRDNIRRKLGLRRGGINLRTHLLSLQ